MPILPAEPGLYPESLFDSEQAAQCGNRSWWVLHTKPRQEKSLARRLHEACVPFYLPLIHRRLRLRGRVLHSYVPLFSGYVFLLGSREERLVALTTHRVVSALPVGDQEQLWNDLRQISRLIATGAPITPEDKLAPGMTVEIKSGPLAGLCGKILRTASGQRFVVQVNFIQRGASVLVDDFNLVKLDPESAAV